MAASHHEIPQWESIELLEGETVGRLCVIDYDYPLAFPVNYRVLRGTEQTRIVFRTAPQSALARHEGPASLEVDQVDSARMNAWSVIVRGILHVIPHQSDLPDTFPLISEGRYQWKVLDVAAISGRRFTSTTTTADGFNVDWQPADHLG